MIFLILYYLIDIRKPFLGVVTILPVVAIVMGTYLGMYFLDIPLNRLFYRLAFHSFDKYQSDLHLKAPAVDQVLLKS